MGGQHAWADRCFVNAQKLMFEAGGRGTVRYGMLASSIAARLAQQGRLKEALDMCFDARLSLSLAGATQTLEYATMLHRLAVCYHMQGALQLAHPVFRDAKLAYEVAESTDTAQYADLLLNLATCLDSLGLSADARELWESVAKFQKKVSFHTPA